LRCGRKLQNLSSTCANSAAIRVPIAKSVIQNRIVATMLTYGSTINSRGINCFQNVIKVKRGKILKTQRNMSQVAVNRRSEK